MFIKYSLMTFILMLAHPLFAGTALPINVQNANYNVNAAPEDFPITLNNIHSWLIIIDDTSGHPVEDLEFTVKGGMPEHQHGLPSQPKLIDEINPGKYIVDGMKFNMYGKWQIEFIGINNSSDFYQKIEFDLDHDNAN